MMAFLCIADTHTNWVGLEQEDLAEDCDWGNLADQTEGWALAEDTYVATLECQPVTYGQFVPDNRHSQ